MHPEVRQEGPGSCPICGMALEPLTVTAETPVNHELNDMTRRFWIGLVLAVPVVVLEMGGHMPGLELRRIVPEPVSAWLQCAFSTPVVLWAGLPFFQRAWTSVVNRSLNMFSLIALGTGTAYLYSLFATFAPGLFPAGFRTMDNAVAVYFEAAAVITVLVLLGQMLELRAREQTGGAIRALLNLTPKMARRLVAHGQDEEIPVGAVQVGDRLRVRPGEAVSVDGAVLDGHSAVDEAMVTGESMPVTKQIGDRLIGGTVNGTGALVMSADKVGAATMLSRIVAMVADAQRSRAPIQRLADTVSGYFVPAVLAVAVLSFVVWAFWGPALGAGLRAHCRGLGADYRLSLRTGARNAHEHWRRYWQGRRRGCAYQVGRGAGAHGKGRYAAGGQDRYAYRGQAQGDRDCCRAGPDGNGSPGFGGEPGTVERTCPLAAAIVAAAASRALALQDASDFCAHSLARAFRAWLPGVPSRLAAPGSWRTSRLRLAIWTRRRMRCAKAVRRCFIWP